jgi:hypothetical protein
VLESLVHREDHQAACPCQLPMGEQSNHIGFGPRIIASVPTHDFSDAMLHDDPPDSTVH